MTKPVIEVLILTHHKSVDEIFDVVKNANVTTKCLVCNQSDNEEYTLEKNNVRIITYVGKGISLNRNKLLENCQGDICVCIDDDCQLIPGYETLVLNMADKYQNADCFIFNGFHVNGAIINKHSTKKVKTFSEIGYAGGPGFVFKKDKIKGFRYNESLGYPNYVMIGEDTVFYKNLLTNKIKVVRVSDPLFKIVSDVDNSSYFTGVNKQFLQSKGKIISLVHPALKNLFVIKSSFSILRWRGNKFNFFELIKIQREGFKL